MTTHSTQKKSGKRISMEDLYKFIKINKNTFQNIGCVNLNEPLKEQFEELEKLQFQDVKKVQLLPNSLSNFLQGTTIKYLHAGTFVKTKGSVNLSLFSSVISCLKRTFLLQTIISQEKFLLSFITKFKNEIDSLFFLHKYEKLYNWSKDEILTDLNNGIFSGQILHILCDYFCINIFVLDVEEDSVFFGGGMHYIPYRKNIFLLKFDNDTFEPIFTEHTRVFTLSDEPIKTIRNNNNIRKTKLYSVYGYGISKPEEFEEELLKYNPPPKKSKKELRLEKEEIEKQKNKQELENILEKVDEELSDKMSNNIAEYDETINGFTEDFENDVENQLKEINEKAPLKKKIKHTNTTECNSEDKSKNKKEMQPDVTKLKSMKVAELQEFATKFKLQTRENGKAMTKQQLLSTIEKYLSTSSI